MILVDTHSHIYVPEFDSDRTNVIKNAALAGIKYHILPNVDSSTTDYLLQTTRQFENICFPLMGLHPTSVKSDFEKEIEHVEMMFTKHSFFGIGEIGIDLYWDKTFIEQQQIAFRHQLRLAKKYSLPVVIHSRNSFKEIFDIVDDELDSNLFGVFHSFTGNKEDYDHIVGYKNFMVGIGGVVTYKNAGLDKIVSGMDLSKIILETDAPWLSPVPKRGQRNESQNLIFTTEKVSSLLNLPIEEVARTTSENAFSLFKIKP